MSTYPSAEALIREIDATDLPHGTLALWWMGQHSFILKLGKTTLYIDPFLREMSARRVPPLMKPEQVTHADLILGTHDHSDHIDRPIWPALATASPQATFVVPDLLRETLAADLDLPLDRLAGLDDGRSISLHGVTVSAIPAAHEFLDRAPDGRYPYLGYIIEGHGCRVYHAGDTVKYEGLETRLLALSAAQPLDVMLLPINGRDAARFKRNTIGNMTYQEAVDLAGAVKPRLAIPTHYDMFEGNREDPQKFIDYAAAKYPQLRTMTCTVGERVTLGPNGT